MFDYEAAVRDGYSDDDIQKATGVNISKIRADGYGDTEISSAFKSYKPVQKKAPVEKTDAIDNPFQKKEPSFLDKLTSAFQEDTHDTTPLTTAEKLDRAKIQYKLGRRSKSYIDNLEKQAKSEQYIQSNADKMKTRIAQQEFTKQPIGAQLQQEMLDIPSRSLKATAQGLATLPAMLVGSKTAKAVSEAFGEEDKFTKAYPVLAMAENIIIDPTMLGAKFGVGEEVAKAIVAKQKPIIQAVKDGTLHPQQAEEILKTDPSLKSFTDIVAENINKPERVEPSITEAIDKHLVDMGEEPHFTPTKKTEQVGDNTKSLDDMLDDVAREADSLPNSAIETSELGKHMKILSGVNHDTDGLKDSIVFFMNNGREDLAKLALSRIKSRAEKAKKAKTALDENNPNYLKSIDDLKKVSDTANQQADEAERLFNLWKNEVAPIKKPLSPQAQAVRDASEIPVGGSEDLTAQAVKQAFIKQPDSEFKKMTKSDRDAYDANYEQALQHGEVKVGEPLDDFGNPLFSKGAQGTTTTEAIHQSAKKLLGKNYDNLKGDINIVQSYKDLPKGLVDNGVDFSSGGKVRGIFNPKDGKVHLVADTMKPEEVNGVLVHELLHKSEFSGENILGESHDTLVLRLKQLKDEPLVKQAFKSAKDAGTDAKNINREMMSYLVEKYQLGIDMSPKLKQFVRNIIDAVKVFASKTAVKLGVDAKWLISKMNEKDIAALLKSSAIKQGGKAVSKEAKPISRLQEWHKDSHPLTKNIDGTPSVFYHGTTSNFNTFNKTKSFDGWHFFTENPEFADYYANKPKNIGSIMPVHINSKNVFNPYNAKNIHEYSKFLKNIEKWNDSKIQQHIYDIQDDAVGWAKMESTHFKNFIDNSKYDGFIVRENGAYNIAVKNGNQIKSIHNRGTFDETNPNILFSKTPIKEKITGAVDKVTEHLQDYWKPAEKYLKGVEGEKVNDARKLIFGRVGTRIEQVKAAQQIITDDIVNYGKKSGENVETLRKDLNAFLIAQHAPERNTALRDGAAGISTQAATDSLDALKKSNPQKYKFFEQMATNVRRLNEQTLKVLLDGQVITQELYDTLRNKYKMHVPLQRVMPEETNMADGITGGKGLSVKSSGIKAAKGSDLEVSDILGNVSANVQEAIIRSEKNRVGLAMDKLFEADPSLGKVRGIKMVGKDFKDMPIMETPSNDMIVFFKEGKKKVIEPNDPILANVYNQLNVAEKGIIADVIAPVTRTLAGLYTRLNPEFAFSNVIRDIQESMIYNASTMGGKEAIGALSKQAQAMNGVRNLVFGDGSSDWAKLYKQMKDDGGTTGGITLATRTKITQDVDDAFKIAQSKPRQAVEKIFESIDNFNTVFEDGTRLAAYKQALDQGLSRERAAVIAKETTIDFNRKGAQTPWLNALYMFSNASIQGSYKMIRALKNPKVLATTVSLITAASISNDAHNDSIDPEWRDKVSDFERGSNFVILLDNKDGKLRRIDIPIGWGIKPIKVMVDTLHDKAVGKAKGNSTLKVSKAIAGGYNPLGGNSLLQSAVPTIGDVATDIMTNTSYSGSSITPKGSELANPSKRYYPETPETLGGRLAIKFVQGTDEIGLDLTPEDVKYIVKSYGGGPLNFSTGMYNMLDEAIHGEFVKETDRVMMRRFYKVSDPERLDKFMGSQTIKDMVKKVQYAKTQEERMAIIKEELPKIPDAQKKQAINTLKYGGLLPSKKNVIQDRDEAQWEQNILAPFKSTKTNQNEIK